MSGAAKIAEVAVYEGASQKIDEFAYLVQIVAELEPKVILEIGSAHGASLKAWRAIAPGATIISISLSGGPYGGGTVQTGITQNHLDVDSHDTRTLTKVIDLVGDEPIDFLFIDADHTYEGARQDFAMYSWLVRRPGGVIAFHDILPHTDESVDVRRLWAELQPRYKWAEFTVPHELNDSGGIWGGIGVLYL